MWGVWSNFINTINEKIEFELRNINEKLKIRLSEEDKCKFQKLENTLYFEVFFQ